MHSQFAKIFAIQPVQLRSRALSKEQGTQDESLVFNDESMSPLSSPLSDDICRLLPDGAQVFVASVDEPTLQGNTVYLPASQLSATQKQRLWQQLSQRDQVFIDV
ncbi:hypothetical protein V1358_13095 [Pseudoalteromonas sp. YIC-656]|uniref:hypothetical protein n=1 Tax=Pseudoalteromonas pernae TaxID=3118054 RepID=UPI003242F345